MPYFLSYVVNKNFDSIDHRLGHASLVLTEHTPPAPPHIICKVGLFDSNQVSIEDKMFNPKKGWIFQHKTYPITEEEMTKFLHRINKDRAIGASPDTEEERYPEMIIERRADTLKSKPGGPEHSNWRLNCKTYVLSVLQEVGIVDSNLSNWLIDIPARSGSLHKLRFETTPEGTFWTSPMVISKRAKSQKLGDTPTEEIENMNVTIMANEYFNAYSELKDLLKDPHLDTIKGIKEFRESIESIFEDLTSPGLSKKVLDNVQKHAESAIKAFQNSIKDEPYGLGQKLLDTVKRVVNYLSGKNYALSPQYKAEKMLHSYKKQLQDTATVQQPKKPHDRSKKSKNNHSKK